MAYNYEDPSSELHTTNWKDRYVYDEEEDDLSENTGVDQESEENQKYQGVEEQEEHKELVEQLQLPTIDYMAFETAGQIEKEKRKSKKFSAAGQLSLEINGHIIFKKLALAEGKNEEADRHQGFVDLLLQKASALGVELKLNQETGRYRLTRPPKVAKSLNETVKNQLLGIFDHKINEKRVQITGLGSDSLSIRRQLTDQSELTVAKMTEITTALSDLAAKESELQTQVMLLQQLREEMSKIIIQF